MAKMLDQKGVKTLANSIIGSTKTINGQSIWGSGNIKVGGDITESPKSPYGFQPVMNCVYFGTSAPQTGTGEFNMLKSILKKISQNSQALNPVGVNDLFIAMLNGMHVYSDWFQSYGYWDYFIDGWRGQLYETYGTNVDGINMDEYIVNFKLHVVMAVPRVSGQTRTCMHWTCDAYAYFITNLPTNEQDVDILSAFDNIDDAIGDTNLEFVPIEETTTYWTYECKYFSGT